MIQAIVNRRSIRRFSSKHVPKEAINEILKAGILAPSPKNRQPWRFVVVTGGGKDELLGVMEKGLEREKVCPMLPKSAVYLKGAENTLRIMRSAPVIICVVNPLASSLSSPLSVDERIFEICNAQSIGAAIENMALTAVDLGLGSLWICDTFFAQRELSDWLACGELYAALAVGCADELPPARPRKKFDDVVQWRD